MFIAPNDMAHWESVITVVFKIVAMIGSPKDLVLVRTPGLFAQLRRPLMCVMHGKMLRSSCENVKFAISGYAGYVEERPVTKCRRTRLNLSEEDRRPTMRNRR